MDVAGEARLLSGGPRSRARARAGARPAAWRAGQAGAGQQAGGTLDGFSMGTSSSRWYVGAVRGDDITREITHVEMLISGGGLQKQKSLQISLVVISDPEIPYLLMRWLHFNANFLFGCG